MRLLVSFLAILLVSPPSYSLEPGWMDAYTLSATQIRILTNWEQKGSFSDEKLLEIAQSFHKTNLKPKPYIPPHTFADLNEVMRWAEGAAFASFSKEAGYTFDNQTYNEDCPNRILFNFGMATGTTYLQMDVLMLTGQRFAGLQIMYSHHPETFQQEFLRLASERGFSGYLEPLPALQASLE